MSGRILITSSMSVLKRKKNCIFIIDFEYINSHNPILCNSVFKILVDICCQFFLDKRGIGSHVEHLSEFMIVYYDVFVARQCVCVIHDLGQCAFRIGRIRTTCLPSPLSFLPATCAKGEISDTFCIRDCCIVLGLLFTHHWKNANWFSLLERQ